MNRLYIKNGLLLIMIVFYLFAGYNHFKNPSLYLSLIPNYLTQWSNEINILSGIFEIFLAILLVPKFTREYAGWGIIFMLIAFIPAHIYFIQKGNFSIGSINMNPTISWIRLIIAQPILVIWAWWVSRVEK